MKRVMSFVSMLSVGVIAAVVFATGAYGPVSAVGAGPAGIEGFQIDYGSLVLGLALGVVIGNLASVPWMEYPRRIAAWFVRNSETFGWLVMAAVFGAILVLY